MSSLTHATALVTKAEEVVPTLARRAMGATARMHSTEITVLIRTFSATVNRTGRSVLVGHPEQPERSCRVGGP